MAGGRMHKLGDIHMITNIILYWFSRAMKKYGDGLEIYAYYFLSNHFLLRDTECP